MRCIFCKREIGGAKKCPYCLAEIPRPEEKDKTKSNKENK